MGRTQEYQVNLSAEKRNQLINLVSSGVENARKLTRARILLKADEGWTDAEITRALDVVPATCGTGA